MDTLEHNQTRKPLNMLPVRYCDKEKKRKLSSLLSGVHLGKEPSDAGREGDPR